MHYHTAVAVDDAGKLWVGAAEFPGLSILLTVILYLEPLTVSGRSLGVNLRTHGGDTIILGASVSEQCAKSRYE
jgi:hypothetical protein